MQDNSQLVRGNVQEPGIPYEDQKTVLVPQISEAPTLYYEEKSMPQGTMQAETVSSAKVPQTKKPPAEKILLGSAIVLLLLILAAAGVLLLPKLTAGTSNQTVASTAVANTNPTTRNVYTPYLVQYRAAIRDQIAQGLHLSDAQLETQLSSGKTLSAIASAQGISASQLQTIVTNAFQSSFQPAVKSGSLTQKQVDTLVKRMLKQPKVLDRLLVVRAKNNAGVVPTAVGQ